MVITEIPFLFFVLIMPAATLKIYRRGSLCYTPVIREIPTEQRIQMSFLIVATLLWFICSILSLDFWLDRPDFREKSWIIARMLSMASIFFANVMLSVLVAKDTLNKIFINQPREVLPQFTQPQYAQPQYVQHQYPQQLYAQPQYAQPQYAQPLYP